MDHLHSVQGPGLNLQDMRESRKRNSSIQTRGDGSHVIWEASLEASNSQEPTKTEANPLKVKTHMERFLGQSPGEANTFILKLGPLGLLS